MNPAKILVVEDEFLVAIQIEFYLDRGGMEGHWVSRNSCQRSKPGSKKSV